MFVVNLVSLTLIECILVVSAAYFMANAVVALAWAIQYLDRRRQRRRREMNKFFDEEYANVNQRNGLAARSRCRALDSDPGDAQPST